MLLKSRLYLLVEAIRMPKSSSQELLLIVAILKNGLHGSEPDFAGINWDYLLQLTIRHRVLEQVYTVLKIFPQVPVEIINKLKLSVNKIKLHLLHMTGEVIRLTRKLDEMKINYVIVKGIPLAVDLYGSADSRQCKDIDLWVDKTDIERCRKLLFASEYNQVLPSYELTGFKEQYYFTHMHDVTFQHSRLNIEVELHFRLEYYGLNFWPINAVSTKEVMLGNNKITTLADDYNFLYLVIHAAIHAWSRLRWLHDIYLFLQSGRCNLPAILRLAKTLGAEHIVYQALWLVRDVYLYSSQEIDDILININRRSVKLARIAREFIGSDYELTGEYGIYSQMFVKYRFYLFTLAVKGQKFNAVSGDLFKIEKMFSYLTLPKGFGFLYYALYPLWVIKYIINRK